MNKVILMGRLTKDPEIRYSQAAEPTCVARYTLAVNKRFKREGEPDADFINCVAFGKTGEFVERFLKKGMQMAISGRLSVRSWEDPMQGRRFITEVVVDEHEFAESKQSFESRGGSSSYNNYDNAPQQSFGNDGGGYTPPAAPMQDFSAMSSTIDSDDDIPF